MLEAVVMAAGEGRRLRPLTYYWPKPLLPIDGRPVIETLLRELAFLRRVTIVVGHLAEQIESFLAGLREPELRFALQPRAVGSADAVRRAVEAGAESPILVTAADTVYTPGDLARFAETFERADAEGALAVTREPAPGEGKPAVRLEDGFVTGWGEDPGGELSATPLWAFGSEFLAYVPDVPGPPYELATAVERGLAAGLRMIGVEIGPTRDLTFPEDVVRENFVYLGGR